MTLLPALLLALVEQLGSPAFAEREAASAALAALAPASLPSLQRAAGHADPEVRRRALSALEDYWAVGPNPLPWVDRLPADWPDREAVINRALDATGYYRGPADRDWSNYRAATLHLVAELRAAGWSRPQLEALLGRMAAAEAAYRRRPAP